MQAACPKPEPPRQAQPPWSRRCELLRPGAAVCGSRQTKHVLLASAADAAIGDEYALCDALLAHGAPVSGLGERILQIVRTEMC